MRGRRPRRVGGLRPCRAGARGRRDPDDERPLGRAGGGGAVAAAELLRLGAETTFFTAVGEDELGRRAEEALRANGLRLEVAVRTAPQRRGLTLPGLPRRAHDHCARREAAPARGRSARVDGAGRDGRRLLHRRRPAALREGAARPRPGRDRARAPDSSAAGVQLDALVHSARDPAERYEPGDLDPAPRLVVSTEGSDGGRYVADGKEGRWAPAPLPGPLADTYGAGDSFAAGLTFALARGLAPQAVELAAASGSRAMTRHGAAHGGDSSV